MAKEIRIVERGVERMVPMEGEILAPARYKAAELNQVSHVLDVPITATQHVEMRTSAVDRAKGFLIANVPLFAAFALVVVLAAINLHGSPLLSWFAFNVFWSVFTLTWLISYIVTLAVSAEGVAWMEAHRKLRILEKEQDRRWQYYLDNERGEK